MSTQLNAEHVKPLLKRGRKPINVTWPDDEFTARELSTSMGSKLSRVSVHTKINNALKEGEVVLVRVVKGRMGRPHSIYRRVS